MAPSYDYEWEIANVVFIALEIAAGFYWLDALDGSQWRDSRREEGYGTAVNDSPTGMRLLLGVTPTKGQFLEIQTDDRTLDHPVCLVEACWTKPLQEDTQEALHLVGCRQNSGSTHDETI